MFPIELLIEGRTISVSCTGAVIVRFHDDYQFEAL